MQSAFLACKYFQIRELREKVKADRKAFDIALKKCLESQEKYMQWINQQPDPKVRAKLIEDFLPFKIEIIDKKRGIYKFWNAALAEEEKRRKVKFII